MCGEDQLRGAQAELGAAVNLLHHHLELVIVCIGVGDIEEVEVDARIDEHLHVACHDVGRARCVVAQCGLAAPVRRVPRSEGGSLGVGGYDACDVLRLGAVLAL